MTVVTIHITILLVQYHKQDHYDIFKYYVVLILFNNYPLIQLAIKYGVLMKSLFHYLPLSGKIAYNIVAEGL